ncbi:hypothetical protein [Falsiroseomonas sp. CW058]|uniref:hypothetical protein n=1 Tax=Falsiroseomonas sp. CW058 TaxID=3388664 RepID=UPI003D3105CB
MTATLLLAEAPFRDLLSRALLTHAQLHLPHAPPLLVATRAAGAPPGFAPVPPGTLPPGIGQVVIAGAFLDRAALEGALNVAGRALATGATLRVHALALEGEAARREAPAGIEVLERAAAIRLRDHRTLNVLTLWRLAAPARIDPYPERHVLPDPALAAGLPAGPILGLAIRGGEEMRRSWAPRVPALRRLLAPAAGWPVLPLPTLPPGMTGDDLSGSHDFAEAVLPGAPWLLPELADPAVWRRQLSPARLKGLAARCRVVVTNRDLAASLAIGAGVPVLGIALGADRRIVSCLATLANELPRGSELVHPRPGPA